MNKQDFIEHLDKAIANGAEVFKSTALEKTGNWVVSVEDYWVYCSRGCEQDCIDFCSYFGITIL